MAGMTRRRMFSAAASAVAGSLLGATKSREPETPGLDSGVRVPIVHVTDLYHPPQDPDDQVDLATIACLPELDLQGVVLDVTRRFLEPAPAGFDIARDPGFVTVAQLGYLAGRTIPAAIGPVDPLRSTGDDASDRPIREQAGINLLLEVLARSDEPVVISVVGSARSVAAAWNRSPRLMQEKTRTVILNAGTSGGSRLEWNVGLDPFAYAALWHSSLPIDWYPCATEDSPFDVDHERSPYWRAKHRALFEDVPESLRSWFAYGLSGSARGDIVRAMEEMGRGAVWDNVLEATRHLWATPSLVMAAGRVLSRTPEGWRFTSSVDQALEVWPWRVDPIRATLDADGMVAWEQVDDSHRRLFGRRPGEAFSEAMADALNALFRQARF